MLFVAHAERKYARQASTQLLDLYWQQRGAQPDLADRVLYEGVVAQRLGPDASRAGEIIRRAEESFRSEEHTSELQSRFDLVCRLLLEKKKYTHCQPHTGLRTIRQVHRARAD